MHRLVSCLVVLALAGPMSEIDGYSLLGLADLDPNSLQTYSDERCAHLLDYYSTFNKISTDFDHITLLLYTADNGWTSPLEVKVGENDMDEQFLQHNFKPNRPTKIISHGWNSDPREFYQPFVQEYFNNSHLVGVNVIGINWHKLATWDNYIVAAANSLKVGRFLGDLLSKILLQRLNVHPDNIHAIGHSLGAYLVSQMARGIEISGGMGRIQRLTALDPAGPIFNFGPKDNLVMESDAKLVDVIHTNSGSLFQGCLSLKETMGHFDFYPNGGVHQPGCHSMCVGDSSCASWGLVDLFKGGCSHARAVDLFIESIRYVPRERGFVSLPCRNLNAFEHQSCLNETVPMGEMLDKALPERMKNSLNDDVDTYYLKTSDTSPFSMALSQYWESNSE